MGLVSANMVGGLESNIIISSDDFCQVESYILWLLNCIFSLRLQQEENRESRF